MTCPSFLPADNVVRHGRTKKLFIFWSSECLELPSLTGRSSTSAWVDKSTLVSIRTWAQVPGFPPTSYLLMTESGAIRIVNADDLSGYVRMLTPLEELAVCSMAS